MEIYNETLYDLLSIGYGSPLQNTQDLQIMEGEDKSIFIRGLSQPVANNEEEALSLMFEGETNRAICEHELNKASSRSHCIFTIYIESRSRVESQGQIIRSKLNLVDLAGSERVGKTGSVGSILEEAKCIYDSLKILTFLRY